MKKQIKNQGLGLGIYFNSNERKLYNLEVGDIIDLDMGKITKIKGEQGGVKTPLPASIKSTDTTSKPLTNDLKHKGGNST